jgi:hypothetical protein
MFSDNIILLLHISLIYAVALSPFINNYEYKKIVLIFLIFLCGQFLTNYGKCGFISIERFFLKEKFKQGFVYRLIKPIVCYKRNIFYQHYFELVLIYILILYIQIRNGGHDLNIIKEIKLSYDKLRNR